MTVRLFAGISERLGQGEIRISLAPPATVASLREAASREFPELKADLAQCLISVNRAFADNDTTIQEGDEVALIPPVGGGSADNVYCRLTEQPLDVSAAYQLMENSRVGAVVLFCGTVREWTRGRQTSYLEYEAYTEMALSQMRTIAAEVEQQYTDCKTLQWHRLGHLEPTEIAVITAASAPHRDVAFEAARALIERLKQEVPIWKKETFADGQQSWQANRP